jgi:hypothetical protein
MRSNTSHRTAESVFRSPLSTFLAEGPQERTRTTRIRRTGGRTTAYFFGRRSAGPRPPLCHRCIQDRGPSSAGAPKKPSKRGLPKPHGGISKTVLSGRRPWRAGSGGARVGLRGSERPARPHPIAYCRRASARCYLGSGMSPGCHLFDLFWNKSGGFVRPKLAIGLYS